MAVIPFLCFILHSKIFYPARQQVSEQGSQRNKYVLSCSRTGFSTLLLFFILLKNIFIQLGTLLRNLLGNRIKHMNSVKVKRKMNNNKSTERKSCPKRRKGRTPKTLNLGKSRHNIGYLGTFINGLVDIHKIHIRWISDQN